MVNKVFTNAAQGRTGVTLAFLETFVKTLDPSLTTADIVTEIVLPNTKKSRCRYVDVLDPKDVGPPRYFVSHRWGAEFVTLVDALSLHFKDEGTAAEDVCVWLDVFAVNQHPGQQQVDDLANLQEVIKTAHKTLLVMDHTGQVLRRVWCLFEIWKTVNYHDVDGLVVLAKDVDLLGLKDIFLKLNVEEAQATVEADRLKILNDIKSTIGIEAMNQSIRRALVESARLEVLRLAPFKDTKAYMYFAALDKAGQMATLAGMYAEAQPLMMECLDLCKKLVGENDAHTASCENNIAGLLRYQGKLAEAEPHQRRALQISEVVSGDSSKTATYLGNLAQLLQTQARHAEAEPLLVRALKITSSRTSKAMSKKTKIGKKAANGNAAAVDDPESATLLNSLASLYVDMGRPNDALPLYQRALAVVQTTLSPQDPEVAVYLANLAGVLQDLQKFEEAEDLQRKAVSLCERNLGREHPMTASCISNLAEMVGQEGRMEEAEDLAREALQIRQKLLGDEHPATSNSLNNLAGILMEQKKYGEAEPLMRRALELAEKTMGSFHPMTANRLHNLATLLEDTGQEEEAEELYERAMQAREKHLGLDHLDTTATVACLAAVKYNLGKLEEAAHLYKRVVVAQRKWAVARPSQQVLLTSVSNLTMALHKCGQHAEALEYSEEAIKISGKLHGPGSEELKMYQKMRDALKTHVAATPGAGKRSGGGAAPGTGDKGGGKSNAAPFRSAVNAIKAGNMLSSGDKGGGGGGGYGGGANGPRSDPGAHGGSHKPSLLDQAPNADPDRPIQGISALLRHKRTSEAGTGATPGPNSAQTPGTQGASSPTGGSASSSFKIAAAKAAAAAEASSTLHQTAKRLSFNGVADSPPASPGPSPTGPPPPPGAGSSGGAGGPAGAAGGGGSSRPRSTGGALLQKGSTSMSMVRPKSSTFLAGDKNGPISRSMPAITPNGGQRASLSGVPAGTPGGGPMAARASCAGTYPPGAGVGVLTPQPPITPKAHAQSQAAVLAMQRQTTVSFDSKAPTPSFVMTSLNRKKNDDEKRRLEARKRYFE